MNVQVLETRKTDADLAIELRAEMRPHLDELCKIITRASQMGLMVNFAIGKDQFGRTICPEIAVVRPL